MRNSDLSEYLQNEKKRLNKIVEGAEKRLRKAPGGKCQNYKT